MGGRATYESQFGQDTTWSLETQDRTASAKTSERGSRRAVVSRRDAGYSPMNNDQAFRVVLIAIFLVVLPIGLYHRVKAQATHEKLDRRQEGLFILATLRPLAAIAWLAVIAWMIDPGWMAWSGMSLPVWLKWTGVGLLVTGAALLLWTFRSLGNNLTDTVVTIRW